MEWQHRIWLRWKALIRRRQLDRDLAEELQFHLAMAEEKRQAEGLAPEEARVAARRAFGNATVWRETCREMWLFAWLETLWQDLRYGSRMLRRSPGFTAVAVLSLALAIGVNTATFSLLDTLALKMLPVRNPEELVGVHDIVSFPAYKKLRDRNQLFSGLAATAFFEAGARISGDAAEPVRGQMVTGNYYAVLGVDAVVGRVLSPEDDRIPGVGGPQGPVAVISYYYWKRRFAVDPSVVGKTIALNGVPVMIVGVTPPQFFGVHVGAPIDITVPYMLQPRVAPNSSKALWVNGQQGSELEYDGSGSRGYRKMIARLKPGVTMTQAQAELNVLYQQVLAERAGSSTDERRQRENRKWKLQVLPAGNGLFRDLGYLPVVGRPPALDLLAMLAVPGLVLLIACANVSNLLLARAAARQKEVALRLAIGAGRQRLIRQLLTESMLLTAIGGVLGVALGCWGRDLLLTLIRPWGFPLNVRPETDGRVLLFAVAATLSAVILFGLAPAFHTTKFNLANMLKDGAGNQKGGPRRWELGKALAVAQVALSLPLLTGAGLLARSLQNKMNFDPGFNRENLLLFSTGFQPSDFSRTGPLLKQIQERMADLPGVRAVGMSRLPPPLASSVKVSVDGITPLPEEDMFTRWLLVGPGFFGAAGIPLLAGRDLSTWDHENAPKVCVINTAMADKFWPNSNPVGRRFTVRRSESDYKVEIVGVVENVRGWWLKDDRLRLAYCPMLQYLPTDGLTLLVRAAGAPAPVIAEVRRRFQDIDRNLLLDVKTWSAFNDERESESIWLSRLSSGLSLMALLLSCMGLYGVIAYSVARRTNEFGIRMALGAERGDVIGMVMRETLRLVLIGIAVGLAASLGFTRILAGMLFGVETTDMTTLALSTALLLSVAMLAGYLPARRASQLDPLVALRHE